MKTESALALLAGVAAGAVLGILFAPDSGEVTREKIKDASKDFAHDAHVRARYARKEMNSLKKTLAEQGSTLKEEAREKILEQLAKLEAALAKDEVDDEIDEQPQPEV